MRIRTLGLAALMAGSLMGDGVAQSVQDEIQEDEAPGSEMEMPSDHRFRWSFSFA